MRLFLASDHRGFELKTKLIPWLTKQGYDAVDCGPANLDPADDYTDVVQNVVQNVLLYNSQPTTHNCIGILICGSGVGMSIAANRHRGIRCALVFSPAQAIHARENDHANMLSLPAEYIDEATIKKIILSFLTTTPKTEEKYLRRIQKLDELTFNDKLYSG